MRFRQPAMAVAIIVTTLVAAACGGGTEGGGISTTGETNETPSVAELPSPVEFPLAEARVEGTFRSSAFGPFGGRFTFTPGCDEGACDLVGSIRLLGTATEAQFLYDGVSYTGSVRVDIDCGSPVPVAKAPVQISYRLLVTEAEFLDGIWLATKLQVSNHTRIDRVVATVGGVQYECEGSDSRERAPATLES